MTEARRKSGLASQGEDEPPGAVSRPALRSSADGIVRDVIRGLYEGRFVPGQRLVETDLTVAYGVSRSSVREALHRLAAERIVSLNLYRGAQIRMISRSEMAGILAVLEVAIGLVARSAAERIDEGESRERVTAALGALLALEFTPESIQLLRARNAFYRALIESSRNLELERILPTLHIHLVRYQHQTHDPSLSPERFKDYRAIGQAVLTGQGRRAELAGRRHIRHIAETLSRLPDRLFANDT